jgi:feruloyl esterase
MTRFFGFSLLALSQVALASQDAFQTKCSQFADKIDLPNVKVNFAEYIQAGSNLSLSDNAPSCGVSSQSVTVDLCRVAMAVNTSDSSQITLEAWFPREYKGRFLSTGNGGLSGCTFSLLLKTFVHFFK